jgi:7-keto-8-aminopelargonate synthetase-like enzyme
MSEHLLSWGFFVPSIRPPTVPAGAGRVRLSLSLPVLDQVEALQNAF